MKCGQMFGFTVHWYSLEKKRMICNDVFVNLGKNSIQPKTTQHRRILAEHLANFSNFNKLMLEKKLTFFTPLIF